MNNYHQPVKMTDDQKREMYGKCTKEELIGFLVERERHEYSSSGFPLSIFGTVTTTVTDFKLK
jgi:hypothetical protein